MQTLTRLMLTALTAAPLMGQSLQQQADNMTVPETVMVIGCQNNTLPLPTVEGAEVSILGTDFPAFIRKDGHITQPVDDVTVNVSFTVSKDGESVTSRDYPVNLFVPKAKGFEQHNAKPHIIPELLAWRGAKGTYCFGESIAVSADAPCAAEFAQELAEITGKKVTLAPNGTKADIQFTKLTTAPTGPEGYILDIGSANGVDIMASTDTGLFWATRTLLQLLKQSPELPRGTAQDEPRFRLRGFMLDCGRLPITTDFIRQVIRTMAWYKMNDLQIHLNDNFIFHEQYVDAGQAPFKESYSAFRLESDVKGADGTPLTAQDLSYTKADFRALIDFAKAHGVNIVPEFDTPGHALSFTRVRPDLIYQGEMSYKQKRRCEMLDASNPETLKFAGQVFDEYLLPAKEGERAVFEGCAVHVGADEFFGEAEHYRAFADGLLKHVLSRGYTPRIWGSLTIKKGNTPVVAEGVQMNLWSTPWENPLEAVAAGFDVINTNDGALYIVPFSNYYRSDFYNKETWEEWVPNKMEKYTLPAGHPQLLGATFAVWNDSIDRIYRGYGAEDTWPSIAGTMDVLCQKMWGMADVPMSFEEHRAIVAAIGDAPLTNIGHRKGAEEITVAPASLPYALNKPALGPNYHLTMEVTLPEQPAEGEEQVLLSSPEGTLYAAMKDGSIGFRRADSVVFSFNTKLPVGKKCTLELTGTRGMTTLKIDGEQVGHLTLPNCHNNDKDLVASFTLPLTTVGESFKGTIHTLRVQPLETVIGREPLDMPKKKSEPAAEDVATPAPES